MATNYFSSLTALSGSLHHSHCFLLIASPSTLVLPKDSNRNCNPGLPSASTYLGQLGRSVLLPALGSPYTMKSEKYVFSCLPTSGYWTPPVPFPSTQVYLVSAVCGMPLQSGKVLLTVKCSL